MKARVLKGSKQEIADEVTGMDGDIREAIVFIDESSPEYVNGEDVFAEMEPFTVQQADVDDSRDAVYREWWTSDPLGHVSARTNHQLSRSAMRRCSLG